VARRLFRAAGGTAGAYRGTGPAYRLALPVPSHQRITARGPALALHGAGSRQMTFGALAFAAPWLLVGLAALPVLSWLLRAVPPAPARRAFPGVRLLLGLTDPERMPERTPWWLLVLRMA